MSEFIISPAPHIHGRDSVVKNMRNVIIALVPAYLCSIVFFGVGALVVSAVSIISCVLFEYLIQVYVLKKPNSVGDLSAVLTGLLLAMNLPSNLPWWMVVIGAFIAIGVGKMCFGGLGCNPFNPALVGRVFLLLSFPAAMTTWPLPKLLPATYTDAETGATVLSLIKEGALADAASGATVKLPTYTDMLLGNMGGSMGEVSAIALLLGFIFLLATRTITWHIPVSILATVAIFGGILYLADPSAYMDPLTQLLSGGMLLGAIFMATDYVTSPMTKRGQIIYGIGIGIICVVIRCFGSYPEGMSFAILIMNAVTPLINYYVKPKRFGGK
ncbi:MAG: RnfABCDGE type electron transport complex subunit D [Bacteroidetes bacterium]|uniref:Ion-translocating oxidoreductase complex subunit D n=1 Tax=Candidatus Enterocola intestinipullorum TaxID=2840783 RepID=A0A9D9HE98_9BACT|nr:RnfABCDGE type electron transport complex subunit D [Candidatus Enterocola intestinipullorum]